MQGRAFLRSCHSLWFRGSCKRNGRQDLILEEDYLPQLHITKSCDAICKVQGIILPVSPKTGLETSSKPCCYHSDTDAFSCQRPILWMSKIGAFPCGTSVCSKRFLFMEPKKPKTRHVGQSNRHVPVFIAEQIRVQNVQGSHEPQQSPTCLQREQSRSPTRVLMLVFWRAQALYRKRPWNSTSCSQGQVNHGNLLGLSSWM